MRISNKTKNNLALSFAVMIALSSILVNHVAASDGGLNLPPPLMLVNIEVSNGTTSYFNTALTNVPSGYDVINGTYPGWCVDITANMSRSPATHEVKLYSSLNPPGTLANEKWDKVNYVLNHKQGTADDIQNATWYFINMQNYTSNPPSNETFAWAMINDALANGTGFVPTTGQTVAVICDPVALLPEPTSVQISIIELTVQVIPEYPIAAISLLTLATLSLVTVYRKKTSHLYDKDRKPH